MNSKALSICLALVMTGAASAATMVVEDFEGTVQDSMLESVWGGSETTCSVVTAPSQSAIDDAAAQGGSLVTTPYAGEKFLLVDTLTAGGGSDVGIHMVIPKPVDLAAGEVSWSAKMWGFDFDSNPASRGGTGEFRFYALTSDQTSPAGKADGNEVANSKKADIGIEGYDWAEYVSDPIDMSAEEVAQTTHFAITFYGLKRKVHAYYGIDDISLSYTVPEPATMSVLALGGLALLRRRR